MVRRTPIAASLVLALAASACATQATGGNSGNGFDKTDAGSTSKKDSGTTPPPGDDDAAPPGDDTGDDASTAADTSVPSTVVLPFYVSDVFAPSGFMGDSQASQQAITLGHDATACKSPRQTGAGGDCYTVTWAPTPADGGAAWAGVYWQAPANNWGAKPGKAIPAGATKVSFYAAGKVGGETIQTCAGGINASGATATLPYGDTFSVKSPNIVLTTSWTKYEISLQGASYSTVLGGFCWVAAATSPESVTFYIDDLQWE